MTLRLTKKIRSGVGAGLLVLSGITAVGCAPASAPPTELTGQALVKELARQAEDAGYTSQAAVLLDGHVTFEDYDAAYRRMNECMQSYGISVSTPTVNPADGLSYLFEIDAPGLDPDLFMKRQTECLESQWNLVDAGYSATNPQQMDPALVDAMVSCMAAAGYTLNGEEQSFGEMAGDPDVDNQAQLNAASDCIASEAKRLYPGLKQISVSM